MRRIRVQQTSRLGRVEAKCGEAPLARALPVLMAFRLMRSAAEAGPPRRCVRCLREKTGATCEEVELLVKMGYLVCSPRGGASSRAKCVSCRTFVTLTPAGAALLNGLEAARELWRQPRRAGGMREDATAVPDWRRASCRRDSRSELYCGGVAIAVYHRAAPMQQCILDAFELESWRERIDDPLPWNAEIARDEHLRDTIKCLNRKLDPPLIRFGADGTTRGVCWWQTEESD